MNYRKFNTEFETKFFSIEKAEARVENDQPYYRLTGPNSVICCIIDRDGSFVLIKQHRPNLQCFTLEMPAGGLEENEDPIDGARREILEEVGLSCSLLKLGNTFSLMMNRTNICDHLFLGMLPEASSGFIAETNTEVIRMPREKLLEAALDGSYLQLAGLGIINLASAILNLDLWKSPIAQIETSFLNNTDLHRF